MQVSKTIHSVIIGAAQKLKRVKDSSIQLVVTSPPYPMIEMWDAILAKQNVEIQKALDNYNGYLAFELMHQELDQVWEEMDRVLIPGGFACINIGDATRTIDGKFALYPNHSRIISKFLQLNFSNLPNILWRKQTNAPNKFMGSGMLPAGAYVTLEHEWILIFRKASKRIFDSAEEKLLRRESAFFWEERNIWFSDLWELKGAKQFLENSESRKRSAAYPFEVPYRLINMFSMKGDTVLDPFLGTGTTMLAAMACERNSIGVEIDPLFLPIIMENIGHASANDLNKYIRDRIEMHKGFLSDRLNNNKKGEIKHYNEELNTAVITGQETEIKFSFVDEIKNVGEGEVVVIYTPLTADQVPPYQHKKGEKQIVLDF